MAKLNAAPTLDDVAKMAGVSTATVSRCLNTPDRVVEATRLKVMAAVNALGYTPNFAARVMAAKRTFTVGAIIPTMENAIFAQGLQAFQEELHASGYTLLVASSAYKPELEEEQIRALVARGADGLLLIGHDRADSVYDYLEQQSIPALVAWSYLPTARVPSIGFDNYAAMFVLTQHVIQSGHMRVAMISSFCADNDRARLRVDGLKDACAQNGLDASAIRVVETQYGIETGAAAFAELMAQDPRPTAVLCGNDVLAVGALQQAKKMGLSVPTDVAVTGFDDIELAGIVSPALTTVRVPHRDMGIQAARALVEMVENTSPGVSVKLQTSLCLRESLT